LIPILDMDPQRDHLKRLYEAVRNGIHPADIGGLLEAARQSGVAPAIDELRLFLEPWEYAVVPDWITRFIQKLVSGQQPDGILDPDAGLGSLIGPLTQRLQPSRAVGICSSVLSQTLASVLNPEKGITWKTGDSLTLLPTMNEKFNLVVGKMAPNTDIERVVLEASLHISKDGMGAFLIPESDLMWLNSPAFTEKGVYINTLLSLDGALLLILSRASPGKVLLGQLTPDQSVQDILARNIALRREGKTAAMGVLAEPEQIPVFREKLRERDISLRMEGTGAKPVLLADISEAMNGYGREGFPASVNAVYVPHDPGQPVVTSTYAIIGDPGGYVQLVLDEAGAVPEYVAGFLNTLPGREIRQIIALRAERDGFTKALTKSTIYLPERHIQEEVLAIQRSLTHIAGRIESLEWELWNHPHAAGKIKRIVGDVWHEEGFEQWMETLPFPLASILWAYSAEYSVEHRIDHLFHFFEAYSQFVALIMLSALGPLCIERGVDLLEDEPYLRDTYRFATFRAWNVLGRRLAHHTRRLLSEGRTRKACLERFGNLEPGFLDLLTSKRVYAILDEVADLRNVWKAHDGVQDSQVAKNRCARLEEKLAELRAAIGQGYAPVLLLAPATSRYHEGLFVYQAELLKGSRIIFRNVEVETITPMDENRLYLLCAHCHTPLQLLPLMKLHESPCSTVRACYFYNRIEGENIRWISYHLEGGAEMSMPAPEVIKVLAGLGLIDISGD
jgi:hypothetical protein